MWQANPLPVPTPPTGVVSIINTARFSEYFLPTTRPTALLRSCCRVYQQTAWTWAGQTTGRQALWSLQAKASCTFYRACINLCWDLSTKNLQIWTGSASVMVELDSRPSWRSANGVRHPRQIRGPKIRANVPPKGPCWHHRVCHLGVIVIAGAARWRLGVGRI